MKRKRSQWIGNVDPDDLEKDSPSSTRKEEFFLDADGDMVKRDLKSGSEDPVINSNPSPRKKRRLQIREEKKGQLKPLLQQPLRGPFEHVLSFLSNIEVSRILWTSRSFYSMYKIRTNEVGRTLSQDAKKLLMGISGCVSCFIQKNLKYRKHVFKININHMIRCNRCKKKQCPNGFSICGICHDLGAKNRGMNCKSCLSKCKNGYCKNKRCNHRDCLNQKCNAFSCKFHMTTCGKCSKYICNQCNNINNCITCHARIKYSMCNECHPRRRCRYCSLVRQGNKMRKKKKKKKKKKKRELLVINLNVFDDHDGHYNLHNDHGDEEEEDDDHSD